MTLESQGQSTTTGSPTHRSRQWTITLLASLHDASRARAGGGSRSGELGPGENQEGVSSKKGPV